VKGLEDEADALRAQACPSVLVEPGKVLPGQQHAPAGRHVETSEQCQERGFARA